MSDIVSSSNVAALYGSDLISTQAYLKIVKQNLCAAYHFVTLRHLTFAAPP